MEDAKLERLEKEWYTVKDVAKLLYYSEDDVLHLIQTAKLHPSVYFFEIECEVRSRPVDFISDDNLQILYITGLVSPVLYRWTDLDMDMSTTRGWKGDLYDNILAHGAPKLGCVDESELDEILIPIESKPVELNELLISQQELHRFKEDALQRTIQINSEVCDNKDCMCETPVKESTRSIQTLQAILAAIAVDRYGYDPAIKGSSTIKDILTALDNVESNISENTLRTHLKAGSLLIKIPSKS